MLASERKGSDSDNQERDERRPRLAVAATFPIYPPLGGGQVRAWQLYLGLSGAFDVELVTLVGADCPGGRRRLARGLWEHQVPKSSVHAERELALEREVGTVVTDVAMPDLFLETPAYLDALRAASDGARAVVACHPYPLPAIREVTSLPVWYEAQDVEASLKQRVLGPGPQAQRLLACADAVERACCEQAELVWACSAEDREELVARYGTDPERVLIVPNGVALDEVTYVSPSTRARRRELLRIERPLALFIASWHEPNVAAARELLQLATREPIDFMIIGSVGLALAGQPLPHNVQVTGTVSPEFKQAALAIADTAVNPVRTGSGTNLKMLEYFASGAPVISTEFGARGLGVHAGEHYMSADRGGFEAALHRLRELDHAGRDAVAQAARAHVEAALSWPAITAALLAALRAHDQRVSRPRA